MMKKTSNFLPVFGVSLAILVGLARGIGGVSLITSGDFASGMIVGIGLLVVAIWLITIGIICLAKRKPSNYKWLIAGIIAFWLDGIINGFVLFGSPQLSGQIINTVILIVIVFCSYKAMKSFRI